MAGFSSPSFDLFQLPDEHRELRAVLREIEAARLMVYTAAARAERGETSLGFISSASKCFASDVAMEVTTQRCATVRRRRLHPRLPVERMIRDAKITQIYEGINQIQRIVMARALLT